MQSESWWHHKCRLRKANEYFKLVNLSGGKILPRFLFQSGTITACGLHCCQYDASSSADDHLMIVRTVTWLGVCATSTYSGLNAIWCQLDLRVAVQTQRGAVANTKDILRKLRLTARSATTLLWPLDRGHLFLTERDYVTFGSLLSQIRLSVCHL